LATVFWRLASGSPKICLSDAIYQLAKHEEQEGKKKKTQIAIQLSGINLQRVTSGKLNVASCPLAALFQLISNGICTNA